MRQRLLAIALIVVGCSAIETPGEQTGGAATTTIDGPATPVDSPDQPEALLELVERRCPEDLHFDVFWHPFSAVIRDEVVLTSDGEAPSAADAHLAPAVRAVRGATGRDVVWGSGFAIVLHPDGSAHVIGHCLEYWQTTLDEFAAEAGLDPAEVIEQWATEPGGEIALELDRFSADLFFHPHDPPPNLVPTP